LALGGPPDLSVSASWQAVAEAGNTSGVYCSLQTGSQIVMMGRGIGRWGGCCGGISPAIQTDFEANQKLCKDDN